MQDWNPPVEMKTTAVNVATAHAPSTYVTVPREPTQAMWSGLARQIIMWARMGSEATGKNLHLMLKSLGMERPIWLLQEIPETDRVPSKGTVAVCIYKAMLDAAPVRQTP